MTAEIAVLNKSAVALATDSAGTIGGGSETKIYNTVNKIFELSRHRPVGIMIYGALDFMGLPLEPLIKQYRTRLGKNSFNTIGEYVADFKQFLSAVAHTYDDEAQNVERILSRYLLDLNKTFDRAIVSNAMSEGKYKPSKANGIIQQHLRQRLVAYKTQQPPNEFHKKWPPEVLNRLTPTFKSLIERIFHFQFSSATHSLLLKLCEEVVIKCPLSSNRTGIVVAGFGDAEFCPTLESIEVDGIIGGVLKANNHKKVDIGRYTVGADVLGFAQDDMVERFLNGSDPSYNRFISSTVKELLDKFVVEKKKDTGANPGQAEELIEVFRKIQSDLERELSQYREKTFRRPTIELVRFMPKPDLAKLAESMIELTSLKRRVSWDQETVGGEVDVAVISKAEGFVWIKRKHYFSHDLNPRFFHRLSVDDQGGTT